RNRRLRAADDHCVDAAADQSSRMAQRVEPSGALGYHDGARSFDAVLDGDLSGACGVEPRDRLVRADVNRPLAPQALDLTLAELVAATRARRSDADAKRIDALWGEGRILECEIGRGECHPRPSVGLHRQPLVEEVGGVESVDFAGEATRVSRRVEATDWSN